MTRRSHSDTVGPVLLLPLLLAAASPVDACLWCVSIDESPAPPPHERPPFSAHAVRDRALLPYQVIGIVASYVGTVLVVGTLLLTLGRRLRRRAQDMSARPLEMTKPMNRAFESGPGSPASHKSAWNRLRSKRSATSSVHSFGSPGRTPRVESVASFDNAVLESDKARRQADLEALYAAALAHDSRKSNPTLAEDLVGDAARRPPPTPQLATNPAALHPHAAHDPQPATPRSPFSPVRAVYPPDCNLPEGPISPTSPTKADYHPGYPQQPLPAYTETHGARGRVASMGSSQSVVSASSNTTSGKLRKSIRSLKISAPIHRGDDDNDDGARTPLSPRTYPDPGVPPEPPTATSIEPETPNTGDVFDDENHFHHHDEHLDQIRDLPQASPQRAPLSPAAATNFSKPTALGVGAGAGAASAANSTGSLPLREINRQYAQQYSRQAAHAAAAFPLSPGHWNNLTSPTATTPYLTSAGPVKTTFVESRRDNFSHGPRTGNPVPYSPYMPFTPVTPVTPHLATRAERKQRKREERTVRGVIMEEDAVADEKELWDSGY